MLEVGLVMETPVRAPADASAANRITGGTIQLPMLGSTVSDIPDTDRGGN